MKGRSPAIKERSDAIAPKGAVGEAHKAGGHTTTEGRSPVTTFKRSCLLLRKLMPLLLRQGRVTIKEGVGRVTIKEGARSLLLLKENRFLLTRQQIL